MLGSYSSAVLANTSVHGSDSGYKALLEDVLQQVNLSDTALAPTCKDFLSLLQLFVSHLNGTICQVDCVTIEMSTKLRDSLSGRKQRLHAEWCSLVLL